MTPIDDQQVGGTRSFLPAVEGMRACAAIGVVVTHVAFETGHSAGIDGRLFGRFDLAVAVFGDAGRHARTTIGVPSLPADAAVEVEGLFEID